MPEKEKLVSSSKTSHTKSKQHQPAVAELPLIPSKSTIAFWELEDNEAIKHHNYETDLPAFGEYLGIMRTCLEDSFKSNGSDIVDASEKSELHTKMFLSVAALRRINHMAQFRNKHIKDKVVEKRTDAESRHLKLQNLLYEVFHVKKEINGCLEFKSADEDLRMVSEEEFISGAPDKLLTQSDVNEHQKRLARLTFELEQRKDLSQQVEQLETKLMVLRTNLKRRQTRLDSLLPKIKDMITSSRDLQTDLDMQYETKAEQQRLAKFLPPALYMIYIQALAYQELEDEACLVEIIGQADEAEHVVNSELDEESADSDNEDTPGPQQIEEVPVKIKSKNRRKSIVLAKQHHLLKSHPLYLLITYQTKDVSVKLTFRYAVTLHFVGLDTSVHSKVQLPTTASNLLSSESIFFGLFGEHKSMQRNMVIEKVRQQKLSTHALNDIGDIHDWVQSLSGVVVPASGSDVIRFSDFMIKLVDRLNVRLALRKELINLESLHISLSRNLSEILTLKSTPQVRLTSWKALADEELTAKLTEIGMVDVWNADELSWYFVANIDFQKTALLEMIIKVTPDYPNVMPVFKLRRCTTTNRSESAVMEIERYINLLGGLSIANGAAVGSNSKSHSYALSLQMQRLLLALEQDLYRSKPCRGRDRRPPLHYEQGKLSFRSFDYDPECSTVRVDDS